MNFRAIYRYICVILLLFSIPGISLASLPVTVINGTNYPLDVVLQDNFPGICFGISNGLIVVCYTFNDLQPTQVEPYYPGLFAGSSFYATIFAHNGEEVGTCPWPLQSGMVYKIVQQGIGATCEPF